jgi:hypothetical protein
MAEDRKIFGIMFGCLVGFLFGFHEKGSRWLMVFRVFECFVVKQSAYAETQAFVSLIPETPAIAG